MVDRHYLEHLSKELADKGKLLEAGWVSLRLACIPDDAPKAQLEDMHMAFFAGAQHLFASIVSVMDPGEEPTAADMNRMDLIHKELQDFERKFTMRTMNTKGSA